MACPFSGAHSVTPGARMPCHGPAREIPLKVGIAGGRPASGCERARNYLGSDGAPHKAAPAKGL